jgi:hypothetical protein
VKILNLIERRDFVLYCEWVMLIIVIKHTDESEEQLCPSGSEEFSS